MPEGEREKGETLQCHVRSCVPLTQPDGGTRCVAQKMFSLPEMAEMVFMELSFHDVLCNFQRVCKEWRGIVQASPQI